MNLLPGQSLKNFDLRGRIFTHSEVKKFVKSEMKDTKKNIKKIEEENVG